ncbi:MAG: fused MFS/spermidine synthase [Abitibacteriaceae bacterium]|nr:fused MFS/spermidine synthase [Abditibacteriaceae bacterium]
MLLYALTIFLSAFLLFQVEPIIAKAILPWFGGTAAVWTICLLFFQVVLLLGYLYAHWSIRSLKPKQQVWLHVILLAVSVLALPITPRSALKPHGTEDPTFRILLVLLVTVGLPYFLLSTTGPLLQAWYARGEEAQDEEAQNEPTDVVTPTPPTKQAFPYRLYALSNAGSMLGLIAYPVLVEPMLTLRQQAWGWSGGYILFALLCGVVALRQQNLPQLLTNEEDDATATRPGWLLHGYWLLLAACPSVLLLAVTNHLSQNVAAIPFLWVLPLSLYLLSFIICFGGKGWRWERAFLPFPAITIAAMVYSLSPDFEHPELKALIVIFSAGFFICCVLCHGELARLKPHPRYLTSFYLMMSIGGALGGLFVGLLAPHLFRDFHELPLAIAACALLALFILYRDESVAWWGPTWITLALLTVALISYMAKGVRQTMNEYRLTRRNFYGVLRVSQDDTTRSLTHGTTLHGEQFLAPELHMKPTTYYGPDSGVGLAVREGQTHGPERVGVIGLGTGTMASYGRTGDHYTFYDINPLVVQLSGKSGSQFSFLRDSKADVDIVMGDARLSLEQQPRQDFDVIVVDAFSSDAIPVHLLTKEACELYFRQLKDSGVLAVHISNRYLDLEPVVQAIAQSLHKQTRTIWTEDDSENQLTAAVWVLVTGRSDFFKQPLLTASVQRTECKPTEIRPNLRLWTDDYSNLYQILK